MLIICFCESSQQNSRRGLINVSSERQRNTDTLPLVRSRLALCLRLSLLASLSLKQSQIAQTENRKTKSTNILPITVQTTMDPDPTRAMNSILACVSNDVLNAQLYQTSLDISASLSNFSYDGKTDLFSFGDNTCATELPSRPGSITSFLSEKTVPSTSPDSSIQPKCRRNSFHVMVSGATFSIPIEVFKKMDKLNWVEGQNGSLHLNTSPATFEVLLNHLVFDTLPAYDTLSKAEYDEFEPLALMLGLYELIEHFGRSPDKRLRRRSMFGATRKQGTRTLSGVCHKGNPIVLNDKNTSTVAVKLMTVNNKCARFVASIKRKGIENLRCLRAPAKHAQMCAGIHLN